MKRILCAAIWWNDKKKHPHPARNVEYGWVVCGMRHHNIFPILTQMGRDTKNQLQDDNETTQGFMTSNDDFVNRTRAGEIAFKAGQTKNEPVQLFSEDLY